MSFFTIGFGRVPKVRLCTALVLLVACSTNDRNSDAGALGGAGSGAGTGTGGSGAQGNTAGNASQGGMPAADTAGGTSAMVSGGANSSAGVGASVNGGAPTTGGTAAGGAASGGKDTATGGSKTPTDGGAAGVGGAGGAGTSVGGTAGALSAGGSSAGGSSAGGSSAGGSSAGGAGGGGLQVPKVSGTPVAASTTVQLIGVSSGKCLGVTGASSSNGAPTELEVCDGSSGQLWSATVDSGGYYTLVNASSQKCLDVTGFSTVAGTVLQQYNCSGGDNQKWIISDQGAGHLAVISKLSQLAVGVAGASTSSGAAVDQEVWTKTDSQLWTSKVPSASGPVGFGAGVTGGAGGNVVTVTTPAALKAALCGTQSGSACTDTTPRIIQVSGMIDFRGTEGSTTGLGCTYSNNNCAVNGKSERILDWSTYCSGRPTYNITYDTAGKTPMLVGSNKTLIGVGAKSGILGKGLMLSNAVSNIVIRNLSITDINEGIIWAGDAITIDNASRIWIDHNTIARIGRQMIVTGWGTAQKVTISNNFFDGTTAYGHYCDGRHYWVMLLVGENQTITLVGNHLHNTSGRSPELGKQSSATSGGIVHIANNYYDSNYYMGISPSDDSTALVEGNYFTTASFFFPVYSNSNTNLVYAPIDSNVASTTSACTAALGRKCIANYATSATESFWLNSTVLSNIGGVSSNKTAVGGYVPAPSSGVPAQAFGPQANLPN